MTSLFGIFGIGGCGRGIMPLAREQLARGWPTRLVFVDDSGGRRSINGHDVLSLDEFMAASGKRARRRGGDCLVTGPAGSGRTLPGGGNRRSSRCERSMWSRWTMSRSAKAR